MTDQEITALFLKNRYEWRLRLGTTGEKEYLEKTFPNPKFTYEELEAANWQPAEYGF